MSNFIRNEHLIIFNINHYFYYLTWYSTYIVHHSNYNQATASSACTFVCR